MRVPWPPRSDSTGMDSQTTNELGLGGVDDEAQLAAATGGGRVLGPTIFVTSSLCTSDGSPRGDFTAGSWSFLNRNFRSER